MTSIRSKRWGFTWDTNIKQKKIPSEYKLTRFLNQEFSKAVFQLEKGGRAGKEHWQGYVILKDRRTTKKNVLAIFDNRFPNTAGLTLYPVASDEGIERYVQKAETALDKPIFCGQDELYSAKMAQTILRPWQQETEDLLLLTEDDPEFRTRKILYIEDRTGNSGKSHFTKYMRIGQKRLKAFKLPVNSVDRLLSATNILVKREQKIDLLIIDIPRTIGKDQNLDDLWSAIEDIKNGHILDVMYGKFNEAVFEPPIVMVFTNIPYEEQVDKLSKDRWMHLFLNNSRPRKLEIFTHLEDGYKTIQKLEDKIVELRQAKATAQNDSNEVENTES